ncbi:reverse transcriptase domain containing protein [Theileria equi strain WA]|uniref:Reverse transcriptase domain containing protein n=1 Tax=Theileria equi strain WA TaxID=1537102 RepID=L1LE49_THEEQ|nr:reverse transcriptase domain containing protein [Theileria equi strain WA]EKX73433.1 reverse transcriptase domain containing protein [Theileria equi strain WA]|eukprot:XP_004832885.1 reverse transcriptase domain containing protein [Theileria equi strain WA]
MCDDDTQMLTAMSENSTTEAESASSEAFWTPMEISEEEDDQMEIIDLTPPNYQADEVEILLTGTPPSPSDNSIRVLEPKEVNSQLPEDSSPIEEPGSSDRTSCFTDEEEFCNNAAQDRLTRAPGEMQCGPEYNQNNYLNKQVATCTTTQNRQGNKRPSKQQRKENENNKIIALKVLIDCTDEPENIWPACVLYKVQQSHGKVPKFGWQHIHEAYKARFSKEIDLEKLQDLARKGIRNNLHLKLPSDEELMLRANELPENSLKELRRKINIKEDINRKLVLMEQYEIEEAERTYKIYSQRFQETTFQYILDELGSYLLEISNQPRDFSEATRILQAVQLSYHHVTYKEWEPSNWKENMEFKIAGFKYTKELIDREELYDLSREERGRAIQYMKNKGKILENPQHRLEEKVALDNNILIYQTKIDRSEERIQFNLDNSNFEKNTKKFFRNLLNQGQSRDHPSPVEMEIHWSPVWDARTINPEKFERYLYLNPTVVREEKDFISEEEFYEIIKGLPDWKACGVDGVYNFFIKRTTHLHPFLYKLTKQACMEPHKIPQWFGKGITYLIKKSDETTPSNYRPITCMSNLYKLVTKCVYRVLIGIVQERRLLSEAQLATVKGVQGAKEQALLNIAINRAHKNNLKTSWLDIRKAFDSIDHKYLHAVLDHLNIPDWITNFIKHITSGWTIDVRCGKEPIMVKKVTRGILQGDSLSPLLFVLCMDPLSKILHSVYPTVKGKIGEKQEHGLNHLLFMDDIKLFAETDEILKKMTDEVKMFCEASGLEINREKSATNSPLCEDTAVLLEGSAMYKYLGIMEDRSSIPSLESWEKIRAEILARVEKLAKTKLNGRNMFKAINMFALSLLNYYTGLLRLLPDDFEALDLDIRKILVKHRIHYLNASPERLYLKRDQCGRGLASATFRSEKMLLTFWDTLRKGSETSTRRALIMQIENEDLTHMSRIEGFVRRKYENVNNGGLRIGDDNINEMQRRSLFHSLSQKRCHPIFFKQLNGDNLIDRKESALWLTHGNISARDEAAYCALQDRNIFMGNYDKCKHCKGATATVDHLATCCERKLAFDYTRRHNEVLKCVSLHLCRMFNLIKRKKIKGYVMQETVTDGTNELRIDTAVKTDARITNNRPDIQLYDRRNKRIFIVEVGITCPTKVSDTEYYKQRKYDVLAKELSCIHNMPACTVPIVYSWDGLVTKYHAKHLEKIAVPIKIRAYMQTRVLRTTLDSVTHDRRRGVEEREPEEKLEDIFERFLGNLDKEEKPLEEEEVENELEFSRDRVIRIRKKIKRRRTAASRRSEGPQNLRKIRRSQEG